MQLKGGGTYLCLGPLSQLCLLQDVAGSAVVHKHVSKLLSSYTFAVCFTTPLAARSANGDVDGDADGDANGVPNADSVSDRGVPRGVNVGDVVCVSDDANDDERVLQTDERLLLLLQADAAIRRVVCTGLAIQCVNGVTPRNSASSCSAFERTRARCASCALWRRARKLSNSASMAASCAFVVTSASSARCIARTSSVSTSRT